MSDAVREALAGQQKVQAAIGKAAVFPSPKDPTKPCNRHLFDDWLRRAYRLAKIVPQRRGMWHSIRRKWATRSEEHTSELQSLAYLVCRLLLEKKKTPTHPPLKRR